MASKLSVIGKSEIRKDAAGKAQGIAQYTADLPQENTAIGTMVRSPYHHARILSVDLGNALRQPDVLAVLTAADVPGSKTLASSPTSPHWRSGRSAISANRSPSLWPETCLLPKKPHN